MFKHLKKLLAIGFLSVLLIYSDGDLKRLEENSKEKAGLFFRDILRPFSIQAIALNFRSLWFRLCLPGWNINIKRILAKLDMTNDE